MYHFNVVITSCNCDGYKATWRTVMLKWITNCFCVLVATIKAIYPYGESLERLKN